MNSVCLLCGFSLALLITHVKVWRKQAVRLHGLNFCRMESREVFEMVNHKSMFKGRKVRQGGLTHVERVEELLGDWKP